MKLDEKRSFSSQLKALLPVFFCTIAFGCNLHWLMNAAFYLIQPQHVPSATVTQCSYLASSFELGRVLFAIPSGILIDKFGRKQVIFALGVVNLLTWTTIIFVKDITLTYIISKKQKNNFFPEREKLNNFNSHDIVPLELGVIHIAYPASSTFRFVMGISSTLCMCSYSAIIGEISSTSHRGVFSTINVISITLSGLFQSILSVLFSTYTSLAIGPAIVASISFATVYFFKESPYYLISKGEFHQAKKNIKTLNPNLTNLQINNQLKKLKIFINEEKRSEASTSYWRFVGQKSVRKTLICVVLLNMLHEFCGSPTLSNNVTIILPSNSLVANSFYPLIIGILSLIGQILFSSVVEKFSRRLLFLLAAFVLFLNLCSCFINCYFELYKKSELMKWLLITELLFVIMVSYIFMTLTEILTSELFTYSVKGKACGLVFIFRSLARILSFQLFGIFTSTAAVWANFALYTISTLCLIIVVYYTVPETRGKSLAEIQKELDSETTEPLRHLTYQSATVCNEGCQLQPKAPTVKNGSEN